MPHHLRKVRTLLIITALIAVLCIASLAVGSKMTSLIALTEVFTDPEAEASLIIKELRAPRTVAGLLVGTSLGIAGALLQGLTKNPVADPVILGIGAGAGTGIALATFLLRIETMTATVWFGLLGAIITSLLLMLFGRTMGTGMSGLTLILGGVAIQAGATAITSAILIYDEQSLGTYRLWTVGSLAGRPSEIFGPLSILFAIGIGLSAYTAAKLNLLTLGEDVAVSMGENVRFIQLVGYCAVALLTTIAVATSGPIAFIGLMCAHLASAYASADWRWLTVYASLFGVVLILLGDIIGRLILHPAEVPTGIVLALFGAPYFILHIKRCGVLS